MSGTYVLSGAPVGKDVIEGLHPIPSGAIPIFLRE